jgi:membrane protease YdiL (CAAX protease family)
VSFSGQGERGRARAPLVLLGATWTAAVAALWRTGGLDGPELAAAVVLLVGVALTWKLTRPPAPLVPPAGRLGAQLGFLAVYTVALVAISLHHHGALDAAIFAPFDRALQQIGGITGNPYFAVNPLSMVVIPGAVLWLLGARRRDLGVVRGRYTLRVAALWCTIPVAFLAVNLALGTLTLADAGWRAFSNTLQNGPVEEVYWRGFVQTRLQRYGAAWAVVGTALVFGLSHLGFQLTTSHGDALRAAANCVIDQAMLGVALGVMFQRTQSVIASSVFHVLINLSLEVGQLLARGA